MNFDQTAYITTLTEVASAFRRGDRSARVPAPTVVRALLSAEKAAKQNRITYSFASIQGQWRLCFTAPRKAHFKGNEAIGNGWYMPKLSPASISFDSAFGDGSTQLQPGDTGAGPFSTELTGADPSGIGNISNQLQIGLLRLKFTGPCRYLGKKNLLMFDFTHLQLTLWGRTFYSGKVRGGKSQSQTFHDQPVGKLPFFAFFLVTEDFIAARGRGGGLALWVKEP